MKINKSLLLRCIIFAGLGSGFASIFITHSIGSFFFGWVVGAIISYFIGLLLLFNLRRSANENSKLY